MPNKRARIKPSMNSTEEKRGRGRPLKTGNPLSEVLTVRLDEATMDAIQSQCRDGQNVRDVARAILQRSVRRQARRLAS